MDAAVFSKGAKINDKAIGFCNRVMLRFDVCEFDDGAQFFIDDFCPDS